MNIVTDLLNRKVADKGEAGFTTGAMEHLQNGPVSVYAGFDPTADSLHVGHLVSILTLARFQRAGHRVIALVGGATGTIGDPSGKSEERNLLTIEEVQANADRIKEQLSSIIAFSGDNSAIMVDNSDWITPMSIIDWLRDVGKFFSVNAMLAKSSVKKRLESEQGISFTEFTYQTMQAFDFLALHERHGCTVQLGGSDQYGNITAGIDLIRRKAGAQAYGVVTRLITTANGEKIGKSAGNAVWLDAEKTTPYDFYQYWMQTTDADLDDFLRVFTFLEGEKVDKIMAAHMKTPEKQLGQKSLAQEVTALVHGREQAQEMARVSEALFAGGVKALQAEELEMVFSAAPRTLIDPSQVNGGVAVVDLMTRGNLAQSKSGARRLIRQGGLYVNGERITDEDHHITRDDFVDGSYALLRAGKKRQHLFQVI